VLLICPEDRCIRDTWHWNSAGRRAARLWFVDNILNLRGRKVVKGLPGTIGKWGKGRKHARRVS
jgi:hypothetical protein